MQVDFQHENRGELYSRTQSDETCLSKKLKFALAIAIVAATWLGLLPWIAALPGESRRWQLLEDVGIDPSAMYYTELEAMRPILETLNQRHRRGGTPSAPHQAPTGAISVPSR